MLPAKSTVGDFSESLKTGGVPKSAKVFKKMSKSQFDAKNAAIKRLLPKERKNFQKFSRIEDDPDDKEYWDTIFTDEWACWDYCLQAAYKLENFWRDHEFGPTKGDPHGYRSIVGN